jgi:hypothetical protein
MQTANRVTKSVRIDPAVWKELKVLAANRGEDMPEAIAYLVKLAKAKESKHGKSKE